MINLKSLLFGGVLRARESRGRFEEEDTSTPTYSFLSFFVKVKEKQVIRSMSQNVARGPLMVRMEFPRGPQKEHSRNKNKKAISDFFYYEPVSTFPFWHECNTVHKAGE